MGDTDQPTAAQPHERDGVSGDHAQRARPRGERCRRLHLLAGDFQPLLGVTQIRRLPLQRAIQITQFVAPKS